MNTPPDKQQFLELIRENKGIIYKICNTYCSNRQNRDDLAQEIIYHLWKSFHSFNTSFKFSTWMYRIALNVAISFYRKENVSSSHVEFSEGLPVFEEDNNITSETDRNINLMLEFISGLKEIDKSIMLLYLDDKSYKEIAEITGITTTNVATKINRIKDKLKSNFYNIKNESSWK